MFNVNTVMLSGRLGADAEIKTLPGDSRKIATFSLAVDRNYQDRVGLWHNETEWFRVVTFQPSLIDKVLAEKATKGRLMFVQGTLRARNWESDAGEKRMAYEIEVDSSGGITPVVEDR